MLIFWAEKLRCGGKIKRGKKKLENLLYLSRLVYQRSANTTLYYYIEAMKKPTEIPDYYFADEFFCTMNRSAKSIGYDLERIFKSASFDSVTYKEFYGLIMIMHDDFEEQHQDVQNFFIQNHHRFKPRYFLDKIIMRDFRRRIRRNCE